MLSRRKSAVLFGIVKQTAGKYNVLCTAGKLAEYRYLLALSFIYKQEMCLACCDRLADSGK